MRYATARTTSSSSERIPIDGISLEGDLTIPERATGIVLFAHGSGSSRFSPRNRAVAAELQAGGFATLLLDLLTVEEERIEAETRHLRFNIDLLATRLGAATDWIGRRAGTRNLPIGYFGASTGAAAALVAAAHRRHIVRAVVSRGGRPDLAGPALANVQAATLLIVGGHDAQVIALNEQALARLSCIKRMDVIPGATHLFEETGALESVAHLARQWFDEHLVVRGAANAAPVSAAW
jgi:dienelactone hydrolase